VETATNHLSPCGVGHPHSQTLTTQVQACHRQEEFQKYTTTIMARGSQDNKAPTNVNKTHNNDAHHIQ